GGCLGRGRPAPAAGNDDCQQGAEHDLGPPSDAHIPPPPIWGERYTAFAGRVWTRRTQQRSSPGSSRGHNLDRPKPSTTPSTNARFIPQTSSVSLWASAWKGQLVRTMSCPSARGS